MMHMRITRAKTAAVLAREALIEFTQNVDPGFDKAFLTACEAIGCKPVDLLAVMMSESGCNPAAHNPNGDASGLIQFMPATLLALGFKQGPQAFRMLAASAQLPYVVSYYRPWAPAAGSWDSAGRLYQATFLPATLASESAPEDILAQKNGRLGWAYSANAVFDENGDGMITIQELTDATIRAAAAETGRWNELLCRLGLETPEVTLPELSSASSVQRALNTLGWEPALTIDGIVGPKTFEAIVAFQEQNGLHIDGIAGPDTRAAMAAALAKESGSNTKAVGFLRDGGLVGA